MDGQTRPLPDRRQMFGAVLLGANPLIYLAAEGIAAAAWRDPAYNYAYNYISDLGVPDAGELQGRLIDSPLHMVMNTGFVVHGVLFVTAAVLLSRAVADTASRRAVLTMAVLHGVGIVLVGVFHGSQQAAENGTAALHGLGALLAILAGNTAFIVAGAALLRAQRRPAGRDRGLGVLFVALGAIGIAAFAYLLATSGGSYDGVPERIAVYTVLVAELIAAATLLRTRTSDAVAQARP